MTGRVVVVTGAAGGIGTAIVSAFRELGDVVEEFDYVDGFDVTDADACHRAINDIVACHGRVDVLCNNAGIGASGDLVTADAELWRRVFAVNVFGAAQMTAATLPTMRSARNGVVVNTCSVLATVGVAGRVVYSASKEALLAMTRAIAADELPNGIRANAVSPATVDGPWIQRNARQSADPEAFLETMRRRQPSGRLIQAAAVARAITYLADPTTALTGVELPVDDGFTGVRILPLP